MQTIIISILIATILLFVLPLRVKFSLDLKSDLVASIEIEFIFTFKKNIDLLAAKTKKTASGSFTMKTARLALDVFYLEEINSVLQLSGSDIKRDIDILAAYQIVTNSILSYAKMRYNGKYLSNASINMTEKNSYQLSSVVWFNLVTLGVLGLSILRNIIKSKIKEYKHKSKEML